MGLEPKFKGWTRIQFCALNTSIISTIYVWTHTCTHISYKEHNIERGSSLNQIYRWWSPTINQNSSMPWRAIWSNQTLHALFLKLHSDPYGTPMLVSFPIRVLLSWTSCNHIFFSASNQFFLIDWFNQTSLVSSI